MTRVSAAFVLALGVSSCSVQDDDDVQRYSDPDKTYVVAQPSEWEAAITRGHTELRSTDRQRTRHTIVIRSAVRPREIVDGKPTTREDVVTATTKALRALPRSSVRAVTTVEDTEIPATRFSLTFQPRGLSALYRREHVLLLGAKHLYHVSYTAPANEAIDERAFSTMVTTLTEGV